MSSPITFHSGTVTSAPVRVAKLLALAWYDVLKAGHADAGMPFQWDSRVNWIEIWGFLPVSVIVWRKPDYAGNVWIELAYTAPMNRREGLYRQLYDKVRGSAIGKGARTISGGISPDNEPMKQAARSVGRHCHAEIWREVLPETVTDRNPLGDEEVTQ